jgi:uncharacterized protein (DUF2062 family)
MPRKLFRKYLPSHERISANRYLRLFGAALQHHNLWHLHRRSVAGGVAIGLFCGLVPRPLQMLSAALCAIVFRVNLPVAAIVTWYTNPVTILPLYCLAYKLGLFVTGAHRAASPRFDMQILDLPVADWMPAAAHWFAQMGKPVCDRAGIACIDPPRCGLSAGCCCVARACNIVMAQQAAPALHQINTQLDRPSGNARGVYFRRLDPP